MFLVTSDPHLLTKSWHDCRYEVIPFDTRALLPQEAVSFVRHRIQYYRSEPPPHLEQYALFPFDEDDIRRSVQRTNSNIANNSESIVTIRQLSSTLSQVLFRRKKELQVKADFQLAEIPPVALSQYIIRTVEAFQQVVADGPA